MITIKQVRDNVAVHTYIEKADEVLAQLGYTEHSFTHMNRVALQARRILETLGKGTREAELAEIAGYMHDIGNVINRIDHAQSGAMMAFRILDHMGASPEDIAEVVAAIGNHDEHTADPVTDIAAALILADKTDVRYTRVRRKENMDFDIHDKVNWSVRESKVEINEALTEIALKLTIDTEFCSVMDYFEIFIDRMVLCRKAAAKLKLRFRIVVNGQTLL